VERPGPGQSVEVVRIQQGPVHVKQDAGPQIGAHGEGCTPTIAGDRPRQAVERRGVGSARMRMLRRLSFDLDRDVTDLAELLAPQAGSNGREEVRLLAASGRFPAN
jgi:hypothetical protein